MRDMLASRKMMRYINRPYGITAQYNQGSQLRAWCVPLVVKAISSIHGFMPK